MGPFFFLTSQRLKKEKREVLFSKGFYMCDLISPQMRGVVGRADVTVPILWMKDGGP